MEQVKPANPNSSVTSKEVGAEGSGVFQVKASEPAVAMGGAESSDEREAPPSPRRVGFAVGAALGLMVLGTVLFPSLELRLAFGLVAVCVSLWLSEVVPPFVPTFVLCVGAPLLLGRFDPVFSFGAVLQWPVEPVLCVFFAGMSFDVAARRHQLDAQLARQLLRWGGGRPAWLIFGLLGGTAFLSMWLSNVAAAALMLGTAKPVLAELPPHSPLRRAALLAIAFGGNFGGMATPIGSGPNGLAIAAVAPTVTVTFVHWMAFAVPLTLGMLVLLFGLLRWLYPFGAVARLSPPKPQRLSGKAKAVGALIGLAALGWMTEPWHGLPAALVGLAVAAMLYLSGLLGPRALRDIDWGTLGLIAGGISLGKLVEKAGFLSLWGVGHGAQVAGGSVVLLLVLLLTSALLAAVMSNTATAALLLPLAITVFPGPAPAILVALAASFGMPFVISTPQNALVYGEGGLTAGDFLRVGLPLMILGCLLLLLTGPWVLGLYGLGLPLRP